jgi:ribose/xylose/arabinose/galactoside ABC-type transport system permease subunit
LEYTALKPARLGPRPQFKILGIFALLLAICAVTGIARPEFASQGNVGNLLYRTALFSILGIGVAFVIITGGIDLSIGSVVALVGCLLPYLTRIDYRTPDRSDILEINTGVPEVGVIDDLSRRLKAGDLIFISVESGPKAVFEVASAAYRQDYLFSGGTRPATVIELKSAPPFPASVGKITRAYRITQVDPAAKSLLIVGLDRVPIEKDRLSLVRGDGSGLIELDVRAAEQTAEGPTRVIVADPRNQLSADYAFAMAQLHRQTMTIPSAMAFLLFLSAGIGLAHGLLITQLRLQPFVVTLCGLLIYRGIIRHITNDQSQGFAEERMFHTLRYLSIGSPFSVPIPFLNWLAARSTAAPFWAWVQVPMSFVIMTVIAIVAAVFLNLTIYGRYLLALGRNEQAARFSGINTDGMTVLAYVICSLLAGFGGILFILNDNQGQPSNYGNFYELYAIAAAVLGGCSLRGGEGSILGVLIGAAVMQALRNSINLLEIGTTLEFAVIGAVILIGVIADELVKRYAARRRAARQNP